MPDYFHEGYFVRDPAWHKMGTVIHDFLDLSTPEKKRYAMRLAGHDFLVEKIPVQGVLPGRHVLRAKDWRVIVRVNPGQDRSTLTEDAILNVAPDSYGVIDNALCWSLMGTILGQEQTMKIETAITLRGGAVCSLLGWLDEPFTVPGDDSVTLPFYNLSWAHDGSGKVRGRPTSVRVVCWNTLGMAEAEGKRLGGESVFSIRHTKNAEVRVEEVRKSLVYSRKSYKAYQDMVTELATWRLNVRQRQYFVHAFIPMPATKGVELSERVIGNIERDRASLFDLFSSRSIPERHRLTGYGMLLGAVEFLDHVRPFKSADSYFGRSMLKNEPRKANIVALIKDARTA